MKSLKYFQESWIYLRNQKENKNQDVIGFLQIEIMNVRDFIGNEEIDNVLKEDTYLKMNIVYL